MLAEHRPVSTQVWFGSQQDITDQTEEQSNNLINQTRCADLPLYNTHPETAGSLHPEKYLKREKYLHIKRNEWCQTNKKYLTFWVTNVTLIMCIFAHTEVFTSTEAHDYQVVCNKLARKTKPLETLKFNSFSIQLFT